MALSWRRCLRTTLVVHSLRCSAKRDEAECSVLPLLGKTTEWELEHWGKSGDGSSCTIRCERSGLYAEWGPLHSGLASTYGLYSARNCEVSPSHTTASVAQALRCKRCIATNIHKYNLPSLVLLRQHKCHSLALASPVPITGYQPYNHKAPNLSLLRWLSTLQDGRRRRSRRR